MKTSTWVILLGLGEAICLSLVLSNSDLRLRDQASVITACAMMGLVLIPFLLTISAAWVLRIQEIQLEVSEDFKRQLRTAEARAIIELVCHAQATFTKLGDDDHLEKLQDLEGIFVSIEQEARDCAPSIRQFAAEYVAIKRRQLRLARSLPGT